MPDSLNSRVAARIRAVRRIRDITQQGLSKIIQGDRNLISRLERGQVRLTVDYLEKIALALDVPAGDLMPEQDRAGLDDETRRLLDLFSRVPEDKHVQVFGMMELFANGDGRS